MELARSLKGPHSGLPARDCLTFLLPARALCLNGLGVGQSARKWQVQGFEPQWVTIWDLYAATLYKQIVKGNIEFSYDEFETFEVSNVGNTMVKNL